MFDQLLFRPFLLKFILVFFLLGARAATAQSCIIDHPRYYLTQDTIGWSMEIASGRSCVSGVRFANVEFEMLKLVSSPLSGMVELQGPGFTYTAKPAFRGLDSFSLAVVGKINKIRGSSIIHVAVSVTDPAGRLTARDDTLPSVTITAPPSGATVSGSLITLVATASDNVGIANVQFILDSGSNVGAAVTASPYTTTWNTIGVADGAHTLYAVAQDTSGNYATSSIRVIVKNGSIK